MFLPDSRMAVPGMLDGGQPDCRVRIDEENPLADGLTVAFYPKGNGYQEIITESFPSFITNEDYVGIRVKGSAEGVDSGPSNIGVELYYPDAHPKVATEMSCFVLFTPSDNTTQSWQTVFSLPSSQDLGMYCPYSTGGLTEFGMDSTGDGARRLSTVGAVEPFKTTGYGYSIKSGIAPIVGFNTRTGFLDQTSAHGFTTSGEYGFRLFNGQSTEHGHGTIHALYLWNRLLSKRDFVSLGEHPYQLLRPI